MIKVEVVKIKPGILFHGHVTIDEPKIASLNTEMIIKQLTDFISGRYQLPLKQIPCRIHCSDFKLDTDLYDFDIKLTAMNELIAIKKVQFYVFKGLTNEVIIDILI